MSSFSLSPFFYSFFLAKTKCISLADMILHQAVWMILDGHKSKKPPLSLPWHLLFPFTRERDSVRLQQQEKIPQLVYLYLFCLFQRESIPLCMKVLDTSWMQQGSVYNTYPITVLIYLDFFFNTDIYITACFSVFLSQIACTDSHRKYCSLIFSGKLLCCGVLCQRKHLFRFMCIIYF